MFFQFALGGCIVALAAVVAVRHATLILLKGSIFEGLRTWIEIKMEDGVVGFEKLHELFTCKLCMLTQAAIWLVGVPLFFIGLWLGVVDTLAGQDITLWREVFVLAAISTLSVFTIAGLSLYWWDRAEFAERRYHEMAADHEELKLRCEELEAALADLRDELEYKTDSRATVAN